MIEIDQAILTRWTAKSLNTTVAGGIWSGGFVPEGTAFPYCIYTNVSDNWVGDTPATRFSESQAQFQVYDVTPDLVGSDLRTIGNAFIHADRALTSPMQLDASVGHIFDIRQIGKSVILQESDGVYQGTFTIGIRYTEASGLIPA